MNIQDMPPRQNAARHSHFEYGPTRRKSSHRSRSVGLIFSGLLGMTVGIGLGSYFTIHPIVEADWGLIMRSMKEPNGSKKPASPKISASVVSPQFPLAPHETRADKEPIPVEKQTQESVFVKSRQGQS